MRIGDSVLIRGTIDEIRRDIVIIKNEGGYFGTVPEEIVDRYAEPCRMTTLEQIRENCNRINEIASELSYIKHREIQELLCEICKYADQEPCDDVIDRAEAMTEIMIFAGNVKSDEEDVYIKVSDAVQLLRELPSVTPKPIECEDAVRRQAVKELYCRICMETNVCYRSKENCEDLKLFDKLPSVQPNQKTGHWKNKGFWKEEYALMGQCSVCGRVRVIDEFCPNCGARMESEDKE